MTTKVWTIQVLGVVLFGSWLAACDHDCASCDHSEPAAPYDVKAEIVDEGVHVTWEDASEFEDNYIVQRKRGGEDGFRDLARLPEDATEFVDADVAAGTYFYRVEALNDAGSAISDEIEVMVP